MKNLIGVMIIVLFFSCTAKKVAQQSASEQKVVQHNAITDTKTDQTKTVVSVVGQLSDSAQTVTKIIKYDTSKPVYVDTGRPPVSEETTITETRIGNKIVNAKTETANNLKSKVTDNSKTDTAIKEESKKVESPKTPAVKYWFYILITLVVLAAGIFVYTKIKKTV